MNISFSIISCHLSCLPIINKICPATPLSQIEFQQVEKKIQHLIVILTLNSFDWESADQIYIFCGTGYTICARTRTKIYLITQHVWGKNTTNVERKKPSALVMIYCPPSPGLPASSELHPENRKQKTNYQTPRILPRAHTERFNNRRYWQCKDY